MTSPALRRRGGAPAVSVLSWLACASASAATTHLYPGGSFEAAVESLAPGDTLIVHAGTYPDNGRISVGVKGTAAQPVVVQGASGEARPLIARPAAAAAQNTINIEGATHLTLRGLEITGNGGDGINLGSQPSYITLEDLVIHDVDVGINFRSDMHHITVRRNHIYDTGGGAGYTGEGMYVGCNYAECAVTDSLIEGNYIHDTTNSDQGDGIEIKRGSHSNIIRDNVIHDTYYPCVLLYGTEGNPANVVERNVMWNCGDSGIQAAADAVIRNNIILAGGGMGFNSQDHQGVTPNRLAFVNNTLVGGNECLRLSNWGGKQGMVFANNAVYCPDDAWAIGSLAGVQVAGNVFAPAPPAFPASGYVTGRSAGQDLQDPDNRDVYPTGDSPLVGAADAALAPADDFNGTSRTGTGDAGAYAYTAPNNPGWLVGPGFKGIEPAPAVTLTAQPATVTAGGSSVLRWSSLNAVACTASGDWSGPKAPGGSETMGNLQQSRSYVLTCTAASGATASASVTVTVSAAPAPEAPTLSFHASRTTLATGESATLSWSTTQATSCTAGGGWSGVRPTGGSASTGALTTSTTFSLTCSGPGGSVAGSVDISVSAASTPPPEPPAPESAGGGGSLGAGLLALLAGLGLRRRR